MDLGRVDVKEIGLGFMEGQREIGSCKDDCFDANRCNARDRNRYLRASIEISG